MSTRKNKYQKWSRVEIHWIDSTSVRISGKGWHKYQEVEDAMNQSECIKTSGYKFGENKYFIMVAMSMTMENGMPALFGDPMLIPKGCIIKIKNI